MNPMSLCESGDSTGAVSLAGLFEGRFEPSKADNDTLKLFDITCRGGWPEAQNMPTEDAQILIREYIRLTLTEGFRNRVRSGNRQTSAQFASPQRQSIRNIRNVAQRHVRHREHLDDFISASKVSKYVAMFTDMFVIDDIPGWVPPHRSPKRMLTKPRRYFADPSIAAALLGINPHALLNDWQTSDCCLKTCACAICWYTPARCRISAWSRYVTITTIPALNATRSSNLRMGVGRYRNQKQSGQGGAGRGKSESYESQTVEEPPGPSQSAGIPGRSDSVGEFATDAKTASTSFRYAR